MRVLIFMSIYIHARWRTRNNCWVIRVVQQDSCLNRIDIFMWDTSLRWLVNVLNFSRFPVLHLCFAFPFSFLLLYLLGLFPFLLHPSFLFVFEKFGDLAQINIPVQLASDFTIDQRLQLAVQGTEQIGMKISFQFFSHAVESAFLREVRASARERGRESADRKRTEWLSQPFTYICDIPYLHIYNCTCLH